MLWVKINCAVRWALPFATEARNFPAKVKDKMTKMFQTVKPAAAVEQSTRAEEVRPTTGEDPPEPRDGGNTETGTAAEDENWFIGEFTKGFGVIGSFVFVMKVNLKKSVYEDIAFILFCSTTTGAAVCYVVAWAYKANDRIAEERNMQRHTANLLVGSFLLLMILILVNHEWSFSN